MSSNRKNFTIPAISTISLTDHGFLNDQEVKYTTTGTAPTGLTADDNYIVVYNNSNQFQLKPSGQSTINFIDSKITLWE